MTAAISAVSLDDKYALETGRIYLTGTQALVRLTLLQRQRDARAGLNTAGFISGYRGSPLGGLDKALWQAQPFLEQHQIRFQPGLNEDLAATAVWGSQQVGLFPGARHRGVFALWYGKGPGVDRSGDVLKHANAAGSSRYGGVLAVAGDDHACKSSTLPHQSEYAFMDAGMPVLNPANVQEILDLGVYGWELSRFCGCWVGFKTIAENADSSASVTVAPDRVEIVIPDPAEFTLPLTGVHARLPDKPLEQELRLHRDKLYAALAFARVNRLNRVVLDSDRPRFGIVTTGKSYLDVLQALDDLGIDAREAGRIGLRVYKVAMPWPLERDGVRDFATGLEELLVVEEKRALIENQLKEQLYNWRADVRPRVIGKFDEQGEWILPSTGELTPARIARVIAARIARFYRSDTVAQRLRFLQQKETALAQPQEILQRTPHFCSGCPHNTSTRVPEGSRAVAGIGCHYMATWMERNTDSFTQMGGEGVPWIGQAPFTETQHIFANLGDGTYFHSGLLAIRAAQAAGVNITYKILYNDAVAMTGGQPLDGELSVAQLTHQVYGEGIRAIRVVSDQPERYNRRSFAAGVSVHHRDRLDQVQRELRELPGVSVLIYDQTCAAEKRRRRKRGQYPDPDRRVVINPQVCEGCGDCGVQSNCLSVIAIDTPLGRKRAVDQAACNKDFSCVKGFCPSFVSVRGAALRRPQTPDIAADQPPLPEPEPTALADVPYDIVITGVGGTGVVTVGALLGMAAHLEGKGVSVLDMTGLAQKFGAVVSHVRLAERPEHIHAVRIAAGNARLLLGCDSLVAAGFDALAKLDPRRSAAVVNSQQALPAEFTRNPDLRFPQSAVTAAIEAAAASSAFVDAARLAGGLLGDPIGANLLLLGFAWQRGLVPLSSQAILQAIELNGVAVEFNRKAFYWGRRAALDLTAVERLAYPQPTATTPHTLTQIVEHRAALLTDYQNAAYAERYRRQVTALADAERARAPGRHGLAEAVAKNYAKLLAYKDEYEVARLHSDGEFQRQLAAQFDGHPRLTFHLAPPLLSRPGPDGRPRKREFGPWLLPVLRLLAKGKRLRGSRLDPFGYSAERRQERQLISDYEDLLATVIERLDAHNHAVAVELASLPEHIRGFGPVKQASVDAARHRQTELLTELRRAHTPPRAAA